MPAEGALRDGNQAGFELIETLRWEPGLGFVRIDRHLARLCASARMLGFAHAHGAIKEALLGAVGGVEPMRVRLTLSKKGEAGATALPFVPLAPGTLWTLRIAETLLDSSNPMLRHKTTQRAVYDKARTEFSRDDADEVLLLNERGEVCEGTITSVFVDGGDGTMLTPALGCGLLPGVLRSELIDTGKATEAILRPGDLRAAKAIFVGNSLRGIIRAALA